MRRAALARWLNLSVISAIIAVLTVVLVSAPTRVVRAADVCGQDSGTPTADSEMSLIWKEGRVTSGPPGSWTGVEVDWESVLSEIELVIVWRPDDSDFSEVIYSASYESPGNPQGIDFNVPADAPAGEYNVSVCWSGDGGSTWNALEEEEYLTFTIWEPSPCYGASPSAWGALEVEPRQAPYPSPFTATGFSGEGDFGAWIIQLIWDWDYPGGGYPANGTVIAQMPVPEDNDGMVPFTDVAIPAPPLGDVGEHYLAICYFTGSEWYYADSYQDGGEFYPAIFTVLEPFGVCPDTEGSPLPPPLPVLSPDSGFVGDSFSLSTSGGEDGISVPDALHIQVVWDWGGPTETLLYDQAHPDPGSHVNLDLNVPNVAPGEYSVTLCYQIDLGGGSFAWHQAMIPDPVITGNYIFPVYTVLGEGPVIPPLSTCSAATPDATLDLAYRDPPPSPHAGPPGFNDVALITATGTEDDLNAYQYLLVWDFGSADPFVLASFNAYFELSGEIPFIVPYDATAGLHTIGVCYLFYNDVTFEWVPGNNTIQFNVGTWAPCGTVATIGDTQDQIGLLPSAGQVGTTFLASISSVELGLDDATLVQVIWDWVPGNGDNVPPSGQVIAQITKPDDGLEQAQVTALVPTAAALGAHNVNICYYVPLDVGGFGVGTAESNFGEWIAGEPNVFNVIPPDAEPSPTPTTPPAPTSTPSAPTATSVPGDEEPVPTATFTPTPVPTSTLPPNSPVFGASPTPTPPGGVSTIAAGAPTTPPGGTGGGGAGGGGGGGGGTGGGGGGGGTGGGGIGLNPNTGAQETTTPGTSTPAASTTPAPTATGGPSTPTPTPAPASTTSPSSDVQGARSQWVQSVKSAQEITGDFDVILTNVLLTGLVLLLIFLTSEIFNQTIRDNQDDIESWMQNFFGPVLGVWGGLTALMGAATLGNQKLKNLAWLGIVLLITVLIEGFLDPGFGFNKASVLLFLSLLVAVGLVTYLTEGGEAFVARNFFGQSTAVRVFPAAIGIALVCVIMSRLGGFIPGILYGFVGTAVFLRPSTLTADQDGKVIFVPMMYMLALSVGAWLLVDQFRGPNPSDFDVFVEGVLIGVFIATIESVAINMLPIAYMDGRKLIDWNPLVWIATAGLAVFLLWTVLLNDERAYFNSLQETTSQVALLAVLFCFGLSIVTWLWFRYRPGGHA